MVISPAGAALAEFASLISRDVKSQLFSKQHSNIGAWLAGTALEDSAAVEEFFGAVRSHIHHSGAHVLTSDSSIAIATSHSSSTRNLAGSGGAGGAGADDYVVVEADVGALNGIGRLFELPLTSSFEAKLLSVLAILGFCPLIASAVCRNLLPTVIREYSNWTECAAPAKLITRICCVVARTAGQVCIDELTGTGTLHMLCRNVTTDRGKYALKVRWSETCIVGTNVLCASYQLPRLPSDDLVCVRAAFVQILDAALASGVAIPNSIDLLEEKQSIKLLISRIRTQHRILNQVPAAVMVRRSVQRRYHCTRNGTRALLPSKHWCDWCAGAASFKSVQRTR